jgi:type VI secretion system secreted protein Hcp
MVAKLRRTWRQMPKWLVIALVYALPVVAVRGAFDAFMKIEGVPGESTDGKHATWVELLSFSHGLSQPSGGISAGRSAGKATHQDFSVVKALDKASPKLALYACNGSHIKSVTIELCRSTGDKVKYMEYKLTDVIVSSIKPAGSAKGADVRPIEEVTFNYGKIEWSYSEIDPVSGKSKGDVKANWDVMANKGN